MLVAEYQWPETVHAITVAPSGKRVYATHIEPFHGKGGIHVLDIEDMAEPRYLGKFAVTRADGSGFEFAPHDISVSEDETRIYAGVLGSQGVYGNLPRPGNGNPALLYVLELAPEVRLRIREATAQ